MTTKDYARAVYCVMSSRSLHYAQPCISSLLSRSEEPLKLSIITDEPHEIDEIRHALEPNADHELVYHSRPELDDTAADRFRSYSNIRLFRAGHPCWRKVTDPILVSPKNDERILIDPDVYFPNRFRFPTVPEQGIYTMWQRPNCLLPYEVVDKAFENGIPLADHTDIGVCAFRDDLDLDFLDHLVGTLSLQDHAASMHVESIVWAALMMHHEQGGHLDPEQWLCFYMPLWRRPFVRFGHDRIDHRLKKRIPHLKCFHAGGVAKEDLKTLIIKDMTRSPEIRIDETGYLPKSRYSREKFKRKIATRRALRSSGLSRWLSSS